MPDSLAHVVAAYALFQLLSWRIDWIEQPYIVAGMVGSLLPDIAKLQILVSASTIERAIGLPFVWRGVSGLWGMLVLAGIGSLVVPPESRQRTFYVLLLGAFSHTVLDGFNRMPGHVDRTPLLYPLHPLLDRFPELYISGDYWPTVLILGFGIVVLAAEVWRDTPPE